MEPSQSRPPFISTQQMREVDRAMIEDYNISLLQMMENAGRCLADLARSRFFGGDPRGQRVLVLAGTGGNGGGGLVCARRLHNWGASVRVLMTADPQRLGEVPRQQHSILERMGLAADVAEEQTELPDSDLVVDALIGYSLRGAPSGVSASLIRRANSQTAPVLSLDVPSGVDTTAGTVYDPSIRATATMTLALPKEGLRTTEARDAVGELYLADISVPPALYAGTNLGLDVGPLFHSADVIRIW
ncbi:MAG: NAD(P)H-hydrate epimerase [Chloroflexi bacterium]|nr:NAD(P)H-hydrate epimerase [Chloroflexota bacterium]